MNKLKKTLHRFLRDAAPNDNGEIPNGAGNWGHSKEVQQPGWGLGERPVKSCADLYHPSMKKREIITLDIWLDVVPNFNKKHQVALPFPNITFGSQQFPPPQGDIFKAARFFGPREENNHLNTGGAHPRPLLTKQHAGERRWMEEVPVDPGVVMLREEKTNGSLLGGISVRSSPAVLLASQRMGSACLRIQSTKWVAQCDVCKYDKPLQYYSFSFGKPFRQEMITDPWYVNDGNADISIWVNSCIFQPWNENLSVHIPIHTWKHHGAISWLLC